MESRRRLGKRHMTAILPESRTSPQPWTVDLPFNLGEWTWEAPTAPIDRHKKELGSFERLVRWIEGPAGDVSTPAPTPPTTPAETISQAQELLAEIRDAIAGFEGEFEGRSSLSEFFRPYKNRLLELIRSREISRDDLMSALDPFDSRAREKASPQTLDCIHAWYLEDIIYTIYDTRDVPSHDAYGTEFWHQVFDQTIALTPQRPTFRLFQTLVMKGVQQIAFGTVPDFYLRLFKANILHQASLTEEKPARAAEQHAALFEQVKFVRQGGLVDFCNRLIESCMATPGDDEYRKRIAYHLLQTLAYIIPLTKSTFARYAGQINGEAQWDQQEAFILVRARLLSKARNRFQFRRYYHRSLNMTTGEHWYWLIKAALGDVRERQLQNLRTLTHSANIVGNLDELLTTASEMPHSGTLLRDMLVASRDPHVAVAAWATYNEGRPTKAKWGWHIWLPYLRALVEDPEMDVALIWDAVDLLPFKAMDTLPLKYHWEGIGDRMTLLERMGDWFMSRTNVTPRQRLRFIEKCITHAKVAGPSMSKRLVANLAKVIVRDLEEGNLGRTARLRYLIKTTELYFGRTEGNRVRRRLEEWRFVIVNQGYAKTKSRLRQELDDLETKVCAYHDGQEFEEERLETEHEVQESAEFEETIQ